MSYETIIVEKKGTVTLITLNRPNALNALSSVVLKDLTAAFTDFEQDDSQGCAVLTGSGDKAFAAGADIAEMAELSSTDFYLASFFDGWQKNIVDMVRKPWIAAVNGFALGGGCELAMMADLILASDKAKFGQPEIKLGIAPGMGGSQRLTHAVGKAKAMDMCLTGRMMDAVEAEGAGLIARIIPHDELLDKALEMAAEIAAMPRVAAMMNKEMVNVAYESTLSQGLLFERRAWQVLAATEDKVEGMNAFVEKRPANWKNR